MKPQLKKRPSQQSTTTLIVIQAILTQWSKASRGGTRAGLRNEVPEALELPAPPDSVTTPSYIVHGENFIIDEVLTPGGAPPTSVHAVTIPFIADCICVRLEQDTVHVDFDWQSRGVPARPTHTDALVLQSSQWGRIRYNARRSPGYTPNSWDWPWWWYEKWSFNIGFFSTYTSRVFVDTKPLVIFSQMADLW